MTELIRIVVVDDHELVRAGLRGVLDSDDSLQVVAEASDGNQALAAVEIHHPDVVVMDLQMPGMGGIEATRRILRARPATAVLVLTMFDDDESVFAAVQAGAKGYLLKGARREELRAAVNAVAMGQAVFGPGVASRILARMTGTAETSGALPELTRRERQVLELLVDGRQPPSIASRMGVAEKTVRNNISSVLTKLHVADRAAAIALARQAGVGQAHDSTSRALVFTEIADSTGLARGLGQAYGTVIAEHNLVLDAALIRRGGTCFGAAGDARRAWFHDNGAALAAATEVHDELARHRFPTGATMQVRVGVHRGIVTEHAGELIGLALNETARVTATAAAGQVVLSDEARPTTLPQGINVTDLGPMDLPGIDRQLLLFIASTARGTGDQTL